MLHYGIRPIASPDLAEIPYKKDVGVCISAHLGLRHFALPSYQDKQLSQPTPRCIYKTPRK